MARRRMIFRSSRSIAGAVLVGLGMFVLYENLAGAVAWLSHVLGANGSEALGVLPAFVLAVSQGLQAHAMNHQQVLHGVLQQMVGGYISSAAQHGMAFALLILILVVRPQGFFGQREIVKA